MGLLDDLFGKEEITKLRNQLSEKNAEIDRLGSQFAQLNDICISLEKNLSERSQKISSQQDALTNADAKIISLEEQVQRLTMDLGALKTTSSKKHEEDSELIGNLESALSEAKAYVLATNQQRDEIKALLASMQETYEEKDRAYLERESKLAEKSEKLQVERQTFQQQASDLQRREQEWKHRIEPKISQYTTHLSLDEKKKLLEDTQAQIIAREEWLQQKDDELNRRNASDKALNDREKEIQDRNAQLTQKQAEIEALFTETQTKAIELQERSTKLEDWSRELFAFQHRVDQIDAEKKQISQQQDALQKKISAEQVKHTERLSEIRLLRSEITKSSRALDQREKVISEREKELKREEKKHIDAKNKNSTLRNEIKALQAQLSEHEDADTELEELQQSLDLLSEQFEASKTALLHPSVLSWLLEVGSPEVTGVENGYLGISGGGPWDQENFTYSLEEIGYSFYPLTDDELEFIIVGRYDWSATELRNLIDARQGLPLRIYSQEMFLVKLATGRDPFDANDPDLLEAFAEDHPALQFLMSLPDPWPEITDTTSAEVSIVEPGNYGGVKQSPLNLLDYHAGVKANQSASTRRSILVKCFEAQKLPFSSDSSKEYIAQWGRGCSAQRLYRIALHLKILADGQGKDSRKQQARLDWVNDSKWLKDKFFAKYKRSFKWPES